jgi:hypothetical protein
MVDERPGVARSEIEAELLAGLEKRPTLRDTQSVAIRPPQEEKQCGASWYSW